MLDSMVASMVMYTLPEFTGTEGRKEGTRDKR
jgi:hypothetical protein